MREGQVFKNWKVALLENQKLREEGIGMLHRRVQILVGIASDPKFLEHCESVNMTDEEFLDKELADVGLNFATLRAVIAKFPDAESWKKGDIRRMAAEIVLDQRKKPEDADKPPRTDWKSMYNSLKQDYEVLKAKVEIYERQSQLPAHSSAA
jgi:hypothetical protein